MEGHLVAESVSDAAVQAGSLAAVVYRSLAAPRLTPADLGEMLASARARNAAEHLSGLLLYDGERFFQWLEGPVEGVESVWNSIQLDARHSHVELIGRPNLPYRLFNGWEMGLAGTSRSIAEGIEDVLLVDNAYLARIGAAGRSLGGMLELLADLSPKESLLSRGQSVADRREHIRVLCLDHVIPAVEERHGVGASMPTSQQMPGIKRPPRIDRAFIDRFADHLRSSEFIAAERVWQRLIELGCTPSMLCNDLVEPAARRLGDLWAVDGCTGADLVIAETGMLMLVRKDAPPLAPQARVGQPHVLVSAPPGSKKVLGPALAALRLEAMQYWTETLYPSSDHELDQRLVDSGISTLLIALDPIHGRSIDASVLDRTVLAARAALPNRGLRVMLYGRQVSEDPSIRARTHADSAYATLAELNASTLDWDM